MKNKYIIGALSLLIHFHSEQFVSTSYAAEDEAAEVYLNNNPEGLFWFQNVPVGNSGIPLIMFKLFPDIFPDIWHADWPAEIGLFDHPDPDHILPYGLGWNKGSKSIIDIPGLRDVRMQVINFSCGSCHTGRVIDEKGDTRLLIGAPSTQMDLGLWRAKLAATVNDPRYTFENFKAALDKKSNGWLYNDTLLLPQELLDTTVFESKGELILKGIKEAVSSTYNGVHAFLGVMGYDEKTRKFLDKGALGQLEGGFGSAVSKLVPQDFADYELSERTVVLEDYFPSVRVVSDIMSVWRQKDRRLAQWDGNIEAKTLRNLGAALGVIPNPDLVSYENVEFNTKFIDALPPPSYPFTVDKSKAEMGKKIFDSACASCHNGDTPHIPLDVVKTDPNRSPGVKAFGRQRISELILQACIDKSNPECNLDESQVITDRTNPKGYIAGPLDGIWARAPYLHNGSIPTISQLLKPSTRVRSFYRGNLHYDQKEVGFQWQVKQHPYAQLYDTNLSGYANTGHDNPDVFFGGIDFEKDQQSLESLLEYLKTL